MQVLLSLVCLSAFYVTANAYIQPMIGASPNSELALHGSRHPNDDKRYTIQQLNHAARHRNVYFDRVGGDPYSPGSTIMSRRGKRSVGAYQYPAGGQFQGFDPRQTYAKKQMNVYEKRAHIARLNHAARHRNVYLDGPGSDPYGASSPLVRTRTLIPHRHGRSAKEEKKETLKGRLGLCKGCCC